MPSGLQRFLPHRLQQLKKVRERLRAARGILDREPRAPIAVQIMAAENAEAHCEAVVAVGLDRLAGTQRARRRSGRRTDGAWRAEAEAEAGARRAEAGGGGGRTRRRNAGERARRWARRRARSRARRGSADRPWRRPGARMVPRTPCAAKRLGVYVPVKILRIRAVYHSIRLVQVTIVSFHGKSCFFQL